MVCQVGTRAAGHGVVAPRYPVLHHVPKFHLVDPVDLSRHQVPTRVVRGIATVMRWRAGASKQAEIKLGRKTSSRSHQPGQRIASPLDASSPTNRIRRPRSLVETSSMARVSEALRGQLIDWPPVLGGDSSLPSHPCTARSSGPDPAKTHANFPLGRWNL